MAERDQLSEKKELNQHLGGHSWDCQEK